MSDDIKCRETINYQKDENNTSYNLIKKNREAMGVHLLHYLDQLCLDNILLKFGFTSSMRVISERDANTKISRLYFLSLCEYNLNIDISCHR